MNSPSADIEPIPITLISNHPIFSNRRRFALNTYKHQFVIIAGGIDSKVHNYGSRLSSASIFNLHTLELIPLPDIPDGYAAYRGAIIQEYFYLLLIPIHMGETDNTAIATNDDNYHADIEGSQMITPLILPDTTSSSETNCSKTSTFDIYRIHLEPLTGNVKNTNHIQTPQWECVNNNPYHHGIYGKRTTTLVSDGICLYIFTGVEMSRNNLHKFYDQLIIYNPANSYHPHDNRNPHRNPYTKVAFPEKLIIAKVFVGNDQICIIGKNRNYDPCMKIFHIPTTSWRLSHERPIDRKYFTAHPFVIENRWVVFLGQRRCGVCDIYDTHKNAWIANTRLCKQKTTANTYSKQLMNYALPAKYRISGSTILGGEKYDRGRQGGGSHLTLVGRIPSGREGLFTIERKYLLPNWYIMKEFLLLRKLTLQSRAYPIRSSQRSAIVLHMLIESLISDDLFMIVLSFL